MRKLLTIAVIVLSAITVTITAQAKNKSPEVIKTRVSHKKQSCKQAKPYIIRKRSATWGWQDKIYVNRTPTSYTERTAHGCKYLKWSGQRWATRANDYFKQYVSLQNPKTAICHVFGEYCNQALNITWCESRYSIWAENGQYRGLFQMGSSERQLFGHGNTALDQAIAAHKYFISSGKDWSPWSCSPY